MNEENDWDHDVEGVAVEGEVDGVSRYKMEKELNEMKTIIFTSVCRSVINYLIHISC